MTLKTDKNVLAGDFGGSHAERTIALLRRDMESWLLDLIQEHKDNGHAVSTQVLFGALIQIASMYTSEDISEDAARHFLSVAWRSAEQRRLSPRRQVSNIAPEQPKTET